MSDLISVIVPVYNTERYLKRCIKSILNQTYTNWELLLINDGSVDNCGEICRSYAMKYSNKVRYYERRHRGLSETRNFGIEHAKGEYLYFLDSDDYCESILLEKTYEQLSEKNADMVVFGYVIHRGQHIQKFQYGRSGRLTQEEFFNSVLQNDRIGNYICTKLFRKDLFEEIRFPAGEIFEDVSTTYKLVLKSKRIFVINDCFYHYIKHENSLTETLDEKGVMQLYHAVTIRNQVIDDAFPSLWEKSVCNEMKYFIFIWNQIAKRYGSRKCDSYYFLVQEIKANKKYLKKLPFRDFIMGQMICRIPVVYSEIIHMLERKKNV